MEKKTAHCTVFDTNYINIDYSYCTGRLLILLARALFSTSGNSRLLQIERLITAYAIFCCSIYLEVVGAAAVQRGVCWSAFGVTYTIQSKRREL